MAFVVLLAASLGAGSQAARAAPLPAAEAPAVAVGPVLPADPMARRALACTACHGEQGRSAPLGYVPRLAGKPEGYLLEQMRAFRDGRRRHDGMARLMQNLDDAALRAFARHFAAVDLPYPPPAAAVLSKADAERAARIARSGLPEVDVPACTACHGATLTGVAPGVPGLLGLPRDYLVGQMAAWRSGARVARAPDCMAVVARRLPGPDVAILADWLAAQPVPARHPMQPTAAAATPSAPGLHAQPVAQAAVHPPGRETPLPRAEPRP